MNKNSLKPQGGDTSQNKRSLEVEKVVLKANGVYLVYCVVQRKLIL